LYVPHLAEGVGASFKLAEIQHSIYSNAMLFFGSGSVSHYLLFYSRVIRRPREMKTNR
jgi:hypothetical protein